MVNAWSLLDFNTGRHAAWNILYTYSDFVSLMQSVYKLKYDFFYETIFVDRKCSLDCSDKICEPFC